MEEKRKRGHRPEELAELKKLVAASGKTTSRFLLDLAFNK